MHTYNPHPDQDTANEQCPRIPTSLPFLITVTRPVTTTLTSNSKDYFYLFLNICVLNVCDFFTLHNANETHLCCCVWLRIVLSHCCIEFHCVSIHFFKSIPLLMGIWIGPALAVMRIIAANILVHVVWCTSNSAHFCWEDTWDGDCWGRTCRAFIIIASFPQWSYEISSCFTFLPKLASIFFFLILDILVHV